MSAVSAIVAVMLNQQEPTESAPLRQPEVMTLLGVSRTTLIEMEKRGEIHPFKLPSGHRRYRRAEVDALTERAS
jgi:predicted DNA-binding transcriptional regulator AlpA